MLNFLGGLFLCLVDISMCLMILILIIFLLGCLDWLLDTDIKSKVSRLFGKRTMLKHAAKASDRIVEQIEMEVIEAEKYGKQY